MSARGLWWPASGPAWRRTWVFLRLSPMKARNGSLSAKWNRWSASYKKLWRPGSFPWWLNESRRGLLYEVQDSPEVHRVVLPYRCWDLMGIIGREQAHTLLRQSVRYCVKAENPRQVQYSGGVRTLVPRLLDQHRLIGRELGRRTADDAWVE